MTLYPEEEKGCSLVTEVQLEGKTISAVIDTAAQVTVVSEKIAGDVTKLLQPSENVRLKGANIGTQFPAKVVKDVRIAIGGKEYVWDVFVAPISDDMLIGLDFLTKCAAVINLEKGTLTVEGQQVAASLTSDDSNAVFKVNRIRLSQSIKIPPRSMTIVPVQIENQLQGDTLLQPNLPLELSNKGLIVPATLVSPATEIAIPLTNLSDQYLPVLKGSLLGFADTVDWKWENNDSHSDNLSQKSKVNGVRSIKTMSDVKSRLPEHLQSLWERSVEGLEDDETLLAAELLSEFSDIFAENDIELGCFSAIKHTIDTQGAPPIRKRMRRTPLGFENEEKLHLDNMLKAGVIQPSTSAWAAPPVLVRKKDGGVRWCVDFRAINQVTRKDSYPLPLIESCIDALAGVKFISTLDLQSGYWQIELDPDDREKTAFITKYGLFEHTRMPFGLCNAPATFQRAIELVLRGLTWDQVIAYLDDVIVVGTTFEEHMSNLTKVFSRFREHGLKLKPRKCFLFRKEVKFLGRMVSQKGVSVNPDNTEAVLKWPRPTNVKEVESFLGFVNYHRDHLKGYASLAAPLYELTGPKTVFNWGERHEQSFEGLRSAMVDAAILTIPTSTDMFVLDTDASDKAIGAELSQVQQGKEMIVAFGSMILTPQQRKYCTTRKELLAVVTFTRRYRHYLLGRKFLVRTDHNSLTWLLGFKDIQGQLARWIEELSQYDMEVQHRAGRNHCNADSLSRISDSLDYCPYYNSSRSISMLPCGGCSFCTRIEKQWKCFNECVDDVVPLPVRQVKKSNPPQTIWPVHTCEELVKLQESDPDLQIILEWIKNDHVPSSAELFQCSPSVKYLWSCRQQFTWVDGILHYQWEDRDRQLLILPRCLKDEVLQYCHDNKMAGHLGQQKTIQKVKERFIWHGLTKDCIVYVNACTTCNQKKAPTVKARASLGSYHAGAPMERVHIDVIGPLPLTKQGNRYILVVVDQFTKWLECYPLKDQTAETLAKVLTCEFFSRFGCPLQIHTDQGRNFDGNLFRALCELLEIVKTRTTPYRPCSNGQVERYNRIILQIIRCFSHDQKDWDTYLPFVGSAIRSMQNRQTGFTPNFMMLGRENLQPADLLFPKPGTNQELASAPEFVRRLYLTIQEAHQTAREKLKLSQQRQKRDYDTKLQQFSYSPGDLVYKLNSATQLGACKKLQPPWKGPYLVTDVRKFPLLKIRNRKKSETVHHDRVKLCKDDVIPLWIHRIRHAQNENSANLNGGTDSELSESEDLALNSLESEEHASNVKERTEKRERKKPKYLDDYLTY